MISPGYSPAPKIGADRVGAGPRHGTATGMSTRSGLQGTLAKRLEAVDALSHAFTKAVEWGLIARHPFKGEVRLQGDKPRTRYVEDEELIEVLALPSKRKKGSVLMMQAYIRIKLLTGMARSDLLRLEPDVDFQEDGIHVVRHKTADSSGKSTIYEWNEDLRAAVAVALSVRTSAHSKWLFCTREGKCYIDAEKETASGWDSMWQRFMSRIMTETTLADRFTEHDLRAKCASDADSLEHARALLSHVDSRITQRVHRRKPERVQPGKIKV
jgi:integrase